MAKTSLLYIATQNPDKMGITVAEFDSATGTLSAPKMIAETRDPAHFTLSDDGKHLYMCNTGTPGGVSAFAVDKKTGALQLLNYKESKGRGPSYVSVDGSGKYVLDANYGGGFVEVYSLAKDGSLDQQTAFVQHIGSSVHPRQTKPYAHWFRTDPSNMFGLVADLGMDQIVVYKFDAKTGKLTPNDPPFAKMAGGMGPRHLVFHPNGKWVYGIAELANEVMAFKWDGGQGHSFAIPVGEDAGGRLQGSEHRGGDRRACEWEVSLRDESRRRQHRGVHHRRKRTASYAQQRVSSGGKVPRYFTFDPTNKWFIVSNQEGANVNVFSVDGKTGELTQKGTPVALVKPMALMFAPQ